MGIYRAIVTRPEPEASAWVRQLCERGIPAVALPLIDIGPCTNVATRAALTQAQTQWAQQHWRATMFVSAQAVRYFFDTAATAALQGMPPASLTCRAWAPGPGTAQALRAAGVPASHIDSPAPNAAQFDSEALWQQVHHQVRAGDRFLIVRGEEHEPGNATPGTSPGTGRQWLTQCLHDAGASVTPIATYQRLPAVWSPEQTALATQAGHDRSLWLLSSSQAVVWLAQRLPGHAWQHAHALTTHPRIAATAHALGFGHVHICRPALADVVSSIESMP